MSKTKTFFVVSDVHGHYTPLKAALDDAGFDPENEAHILICCGDYFDRGTENLSVLKYFERLKHRVLLRGNHEDLLLEVFRTGRLKPHNYLNGTLETIVEFFGKYALDGATDEIDFSGRERSLDRITEFIGETGDYFETAHYVFTHGWLPTVLRDERPCIAPNWREASAAQWQAARWTKWTDMVGVCDRLPDKTVVCGHFPAFFGNRFDPTVRPDTAVIFRGDGVIAIDGGTYTTGRVNVLVVEDELL